MTLSYSELDKIVETVFRKNLRLFRSISDYCRNEEDDYMRNHRFSSPYEYEASSVYGDMLLDILENRTAFRRELKAVDEKYIFQYTTDREDIEYIWDCVYTRILLNM